MTHRLAQHRVVLGQRRKLARGQACDARYRFRGHGFDARAGQRVHRRGLQRVGEECRAVAAARQRGPARHARRSATAPGAPRALPGIPRRRAPRRRASWRVPPNPRRRPAARRAAETGEAPRRWPPPPPGQSRTARWDAAHARRCHGRARSTAWGRLRLRRRGIRARDRVRRGAGVRPARPSRAASFASHSASAAPSNLAGCRAAERIAARTASTSSASGAPMPDICSRARAEQRRHGRRSRRHRARFCRAPFRSRRDRIVRNACPAKSAGVRTRPQAPKHRRTRHR